jgi:hypothetical protein
MHPSRLRSKNKNQRQERLWKILGVGKSANTVVSEYINRVILDGGTVEGLGCLSNKINEFLNISASE